MNLVRPTDYREWISISSGLGMTYTPPPTEAQAQAQAGPPTFDNVFVTPLSCRSFLPTGKWPDKTVFVLEFRTSGSDASINKVGLLQSDLLSVEAEVKGARFPDGWDTAVERTFVQFYSTLMDAARRKGTVKAGF